MKSQLALVVSLLVFRFHSADTKSGEAPCPLQSDVGSVFTGTHPLTKARVTLAADRALIRLIPQYEVQCYNYSFPYEFSQPP